MDPTDRELVERARKGDHGAFDALVARHGPSLHRTAVMIVGQPGHPGNAADAQDIVQETLLGAYRGLARFDGRSAVRTWLVGILVRQAALLKRRAGRPTVSLDAVKVEPVAGGSGGEAADARLDLAALLAALSPEHREVIVLRELEGLSYDQIGELLGIARGTVESRLFRARQALRGIAEDGSTEG
ncbi:MAG: RNA polymerase sigma factor [Planctomycetota bacterium]|nr:RNA polymerase sigma factor [Planctomycetota bacterium]